MIGFIAGAGIVVRNSIILVDFIEMRLRDPLSISPATQRSRGSLRWTWKPEKEVLPMLEELGIGFVPFSPLGKGFLTGQIDPSRLPAMKERESINAMIEF